MNRSDAVIVNQKLKGRDFHGMRGTPEYNSWIGMFQRCTNPKHKDYERYGGRGIRICRRWYKFPNFLKDMGLKPNCYTLERINNNDGYHSKNCKWATHVEQARNQRIYKNNSTGIKGVCKRKNGKYQVCIGIKTHSKYIGTFETIAEAKRARQAAEEKYW